MFSPTSSAGLLAIVATLGVSAAQATPKHILFVVIDDLGFSDLSYKKDLWNITGPLFPTPSLDALAGDGIKLESYYTHFLCSPSRTAMLTGRYAYTLGGNDEVIVNGVPDQMPTNIRTVADHLSSHGWATSAYGKWDAGMTTWGCTPNCRGFDYWSGYYNADNDYFTHVVSGGLDLRVNFDVDTANRNESGVYETELVTRRVQAWINTTIAARGPDAPTFAYVAHQAIHAPQQVPAQYVAGYCTTAIDAASNPIRAMACGQMRAVDESIANITDTYKALGIWNDTLVIFTADNGGNTDTGGSNWPLRGAKATMFEGGVRAASFISGAGIPASSRGTVSWELYTLVDWLPSILGLAGINLTETTVPKYPYQAAPPALDGMDVWTSMTTGTPSPRTEFLVNLCPTTCWAGDGPNNQPPCNIPGMGAIRVGNWKLIKGHVGVFARGTQPKGNMSTSFCGPRDGLPQENTFPLNVTVETTAPFCPTGWVPPPGSGFDPIPPPDVPACFGSDGHPSLPCNVYGTDYLSGGTWLFDVVNDPTEQHDMAAAHPEIVAQLMARLQAYNATNIPQSNSPQDPAAAPSHFGGVWTPWRGDAVPAHCDPNTTVKGVLKSNFDGVIFTAQAPQNRASHELAGSAAEDGDSGTGSAAAGYLVQAVGWAWDSGAANGGRAPLTVTLHLDGQTVGSFIANVSRPGLVPKTGAPDPNHGFNWTWPSGAAATVSSGKHTVAVFVDAAANDTAVALHGSPQCYCDRVLCAC